MLVAMAQAKCVVPCAAWGFSRSAQQCSSSLAFKQSCSSLSSRSVCPRPRRHSRSKLTLLTIRASYGGSAAQAGGAGSNNGSNTGSSNSYTGSMSDENAVANFCIIEGRDTVQDFARMELNEIKDNITIRRNRIFLLMEEVRRLRIQQRIKSIEEKKALAEENEEDEIPDFPSSIPFLPPLTNKTLKQYYATYFAMIAGIIVFGGLLAPTLELRLGVGGTSYEDFIRSLHLPLQLSQVDPIVASFSGGAVGVISALLVVELNNVEQQEHKRCKYCHGTGYLACARCSGTGALIQIGATQEGRPVASKLRVRADQRCPNCVGAAKVMCPTCLCTGMALATEHDPRIDPFD